MIQAQVHYIKVQVESGMFPSEKAVRFKAGGVNYHLLVDETDLSGEDQLTVIVLHEEDGQTLVRLPRETFTSGSTIRVPSGLLQEARA